MCGFNFGNSGSCCWIIVLVLLFLLFCNNNNNVCGANNCVDPCQPQCNPCC